MCVCVCVRFPGELFLVLLSVSLLVSQSGGHHVTVLPDAELLPRLLAAAVLVSFEQRFSKPLLVCLVGC